MQPDVIQKRIYQIRGYNVMLDFDLAELYDVETRVLNQAVKRNNDIFPDDFMFELTKKEWESMSSQIVMTYPLKRPKSAIPKAFTEHGVAMLSNVLKSKKARNTSVTPNTQYPIPNTYLTISHIYPFDLPINAYGIGVCHS